MFLTITIVVALALVIFLFMQQPKFGRRPSGIRLEKITYSPNYKNGTFQNQHDTPALAEGVSMVAVLSEFLFKKHPNKRPSKPLPSVKTNLFSLSPEEDVLIWMGHSSYFMQVDGKKILVDPVLSGNASPLSSGTKAFAGADIYKVDDIPGIDLLFISHDHWDHLDYKVMKSIRPKVKRVITGLGTGEHLEKWGFSKEVISEKDWNESVQLEEGFKVTVTPARHFAGRTFKRNTALWVSFVLQTPRHTIFIGGDGGYDTHFKKIGNDHGPFDLAVLECGQYDKSWKYIHMMPEEVVQAAQDLQAKKLLAVHWAKFTLANHAWKDPIERVSKTAKENNVPLLTPMIGEKVNINAHQNTFSSWWENIV